MTEITTLSAEPRAQSGKGPARATRRTGRVPGIIYGDNKDPVPITLERRELSRALARRAFLATLVDVRVGDTAHRTLPREVQYHPATGAPLHVDFMRVGGNTRVTVTVPVAFRAITVERPFMRSARKTATPAVVLPTSPEVPSMRYIGALRSVPPEPVTPNCRMFSVSPRSPHTIPR